MSVAEIFIVASEANDQACRIPERSFQDRYIALLLFAGACVYLQFFRSYTTLHSDEGIVLEGAQRILRGQVLYRDFFSFYTPGSYYWTALLLKLFGNSILTARMALVTYGGVFAALGYLLARRVCSRGASALAVGLAGVVSLPYSFYVQHSWDSSLLSLLTIYCAVRVLETRKFAWTFAAATFTALAVLFEHSKGAGLALGLTLGFGMLAATNRVRFTAKQLLMLVFGFAWPFVVTFLYFGSQHAIGAMLAQWLWPLQHYSTVNRVNYGYLHLSAAQWNALHGGSWLWRAFAYFVISPAVAVAVLPFLTLAVLVWHSSRLRSGDQRVPYYVVVGAALLGLWLPVVVLRPDVAHLIYLTPLFAVTGSWILDARHIPLKIFRAGKPVLIWYLLGSFAAFGLALLLNAVTAKNTLETRRGVLHSSEKDTVIPYVMAHIAAGGMLFVYPYEPLYYYLTDTTNPTSLDFLQAGMHTSEQAQRVLEELQSRQAPVAVFTPSFRDFVGVSWPNTPLSVVAAKDPVAEYLVHSYRLCQLLSSGPQVYWYMVRRPQACPEGAQFGR